MWAELFHFPLVCRLTGGQAGVQHCTPPGLSQPCWSTILSPTDLGVFPQHLNGSQLLNPQRALRVPSQGNVDDAEGHQVGIRSRGCSEQGKVWGPACQAQHSWAAQLPPMWGCGGANLDNLPLSRQQIVHKLISSWISMVTMKDTSIFTSAPTTAIFVLMTMLTNAHLYMPFLARVTCTQRTYRHCSLEEQWFVI